MQDVVVDQQVVAEVVEVGSHVSKETADLGGKVDDMGGAVLLKDGLGLGGVTRERRRKETGVVKIDPYTSVTVAAVVDLVQYIHSQRKQQKSIEISYTRLPSLEVR